MFGVALAVLTTAPSFGVAQPSRPAKAVARRLARVEALLAEQTREMVAQNDRLATQDRLIHTQQTQIDRLSAARTTLAQSEPPPAPLGARAPESPTSGSSTQSVLGAAPPDGAPPSPTSEAGLPGTPVGQAPQKIRPTLIEAMPPELGVLTPKGHAILEPSIEYDRAGANRLVFEGVEIIPGLNLGLVDATTADRDLVVATGDLRYGLTNRLELEARVPFVYRNDRITTLQQQVAGEIGPATQTVDLHGADVGDVEFAARYQINPASEGRPIFIANLRVKTDTGRGPYDVSFDANGIATNLATGSGFWGVEPGMTVLLPSDPVVLFANVGYLFSFGRDINKTIGTTHVGEVYPGDSVDAAAGFGFAVNPRFSFSLGFQNSYVFGTGQYLGTSFQRSNDLEVGSITFGWAYRLRSNLLISSNIQFGVTPDAPNLRLTVRLPISF